MIYANCPTPFDESHNPQANKSIFDGRKGINWFDYMQLYKILTDLLVIPNELERRVN